MNASMIKFACGYCGQWLKADVDMAGSSAECPRCQKVQVVPYKSGAVNFECPSCHHHLSADAHSIGDTVTCGHCLQHAVVPDRSNISEPSRVIAVPAPVAASTVPATSGPRSESGHRYLTPVLVTLLRVVGTAACVIIGVVMLVATAGARGNSVAQWVGRLLILVGWIPVVIVTEALAVLFEIRDLLQQATNRTMLLLLCVVLAAPALAAEKSQKQLEAEARRARVADGIYPGKPRWWEMAKTNVAEKAERRTVDKMAWAGRKIYERSFSESASTTTEKIHVPEGAQMAWVTSAGQADFCSVLISMTTDGHDRFAHASSASCGRGWSAIPEPGTYRMNIYCAGPSTIGIYVPGEESAE